MQNNYLEYPAIGTGGDYERSQEHTNVSLSCDQSDLGYLPYDECFAIRLDTVVETTYSLIFNKQQQKILKVALTEREGGSYVG